MLSTSADLFALRLPSLHKDWRNRQLMTLFGAVQVEAPRFNPCRRRVASRRIVSPLVEIMPDRCTQEYERVLAKIRSLTAGCGANLRNRRCEALGNIVWLMRRELRSRFRVIRRAKLTP